jgi:hypothetical protein
MRSALPFGYWQSSRTSKNSLLGPETLPGAVDALMTNVLGLSTRAATSPPEEGSEAPSDRRLSEPTRGRAVRAPPFGPREGLPRFGAATSSQARSLD